MKRIPDQPLHNLIASKCVDRRIFSSWEGLINACNALKFLKGRLGYCTGVGWTKHDPNLYFELKNINITTIFYIHTAKHGSEWFSFYFIDS